VRIHVAENPYVCRDCSKRFANCSSLKQHVPFHTVAMSFACRYRKIRFKFACELETHQRTDVDAEAVHVSRLQQNISVD
jgi:hypothetical protein